MHLLAAQDMVSPVCVLSKIFLGTKRHVPLTKNFLFCEGGSLASIEDPSEQEFIQRNAKIFQDSHASFWIGLFKNNKGTVTFSALPNKYSAMEVKRQEKGKTAW